MGTPPARSESGSGGASGDSLDGPASSEPCVGSGVAGLGSGSITSGISPPLSSQANASARLAPSTSPGCSLLLARSSSRCWRLSRAVTRAWTRSQVESTGIENGSILSGSIGSRTVLRGREIHTNPSALGLGTTLVAEGGRRAEGSLAGKTEAEGVRVPISISSVALRRRLPHRRKRWPGGVSPTSNRTFFLGGFFALPRPTEDPTDVDRVRGSGRGGASCASASSSSGGGSSGRLNRGRCALVLALRCDDADESDESVMDWLSRGGIASPIAILARTDSGRRESELDLRLPEPSSVRTSWSPSRSSSRWGFGM